MPTVNINGVPPGGGKPTQGPAGPNSFTVTDNPNRQRDFEAAKKSIARAKDVYGEALAQQAKQITEEGKRISSYSRIQAANQKKLDSVTNKEIKQREQQLREDARDNTKLKREQTTQQHNENTLRRRQQSEAQRRINAESALGRTYGNMSYRAGGQLTPAGHRGLTRAAEVYNDRVGAFQRRFGQAPGVGSASSITGGLGSEGNAYRVQNIGRLGSMGQRAADDRSWVQLAKIEHDLKRIESVNDRAAKTARSPQEQANIVRQRDALLGARERIAAARVGINPVIGAAGNVAGGIGAFLANPVTSLIVAGVTAVATAPMLYNKIYSSIVAQQAPYQNFRIGISDIARAGGYSTDELQNRVLRGGAEGMIPGNGLADEMDALGISPSRFTQTLGAYGVGTQNATQAVHVATGVRGAYLSPNMGLDEDTLSKMLGLGRTTGAVGGGQMFDSDMQKYFQKLQQVMSMSTSQGIDRSKLVSTFASITSGSGLTTNVPGMANLQANMISSGAVGARSGNDISSFVQDMQRSATSLGTGDNLFGNQVYSSYFAKHGGTPTTKEALQKSLGMSDDDFNQMTSQPGAQMALEGYLSAAKSGDPAALTYLGQLVQNDQATQQRVLEGSSYGSMKGNANLWPRITKSFYGTDLGRSLEVMSGSAGGNQLPGAAIAPSGEIQGKIANAARKWNVPLPAAMALFRKESSFQNIASSDPNSSAFGYGQVLKGTAEGMGYSAADRMDPDKNIDMSMQYYSEQLAASGGNTAAGYEKFHYGPKGGYNKQDANKFTSFEQQYGASPVPEYRRQGSGEAADIQASKYVTDAVDLTVKGLGSLTTAAMAAANALAKIGMSQPLPGYGNFNLGDGVTMPVPHDMGNNGSVPVK